MDVVLHLGAHKTASTYLQICLQINAERLAQQGVAVATPAGLRVGAPSGLARLFRGRRAASPGAAALAASGQRAIRMGAQRLVISEENLIGHLDRFLLGGWFYDGAGGRLRRALSGLDQVRTEPPTVLIAVRNYACFFPSAYAQAIRGHGFQPFDAKLKQSLLVSVRGWADLVAEISRVLPEGTRLRVWPYEAMAQIESIILMYLVGGRAAPGMVRPAVHPMPGPTEAAIARLSELARTESAPDARQVGEILGAFSKADGHTAFDPWTSRERALLERRYAQDLERIADAWPQALLALPDGAPPVRAA